MRKLLYFTLISLLFISYSCKEDKDVEALYAVKISLVYPESTATNENVKVLLSNKTNGSKFEALTSKEGVAEFKLAAGVYDISVSEKRSTNFQTILFTGNKTITVTDNWDAAENVKLDLSQSKASQVIIKEVFVGGTPKDDNSGTFIYDRYVILYNNSEFKADISKLALAMVMPFNSNGTNKYYNGTSLLYESEGWIPAAQAVWHFNSDVIIEPYSQIVIALNNAVNNTVTYSNSIDFANAEYYCTYDINSFNHSKAYVAPASQIPTGNYLSALKYGVGTAWALSTTSPGLFIFSPKDQNLKDFVSDASSTYDVYGSGMLLDKKVPTDWIIDGVEIFRASYDNQKRLTASIDAGSVTMTSKLGYSIYRNVDKEATEALEGNKGKLVYSYNGGTQDVSEGSTDASEIDAEASIANGAKIIYKDTNNSSDDFHQRMKASLRKN